MTGDDALAMLRFLSLAGELKRVRRQGWIDRGVDLPESVADHSWSVALLAWSLAAGRNDLERERVLLLGLVHDLPEALAGDTTPFDNLRDASGHIPTAQFDLPPVYTEDLDRQKQAAESAALEEMLTGLPASLAEDIRSAWWEYEEARTPEARFVKQVDKLETLLQAERYRMEQPELVLESFRHGARRDITDWQLRELLTRALDERSD